MSDDVEAAIQAERARRAQLRSEGGGQGPATASVLPDQNAADELTKRGYVPLGSGNDEAVDPSATGGYATEYVSSISVGNYSDKYSTKDFAIPKKDRFSYTAPKHFLDELQEADEDEDDPFKARGAGASTVAERESEYHARWRKRQLSPGRVDTSIDSKAQGDDEQRPSYAEIMRRVNLEKEEQEVYRKIAEIEKQKETKGEPSTEVPAAKRRRRRWDVATSGQPEFGDDSSATLVEEDATTQAQQQPLRRKNRWDQTPAVVSQFEATPFVKATELSETPRRARSRWDETPDVSMLAGSGGMADMYGATPAGDMGMVTPAPDQFKAAGMMTPVTAASQRWAKEIEVRNRPMTDEELDELLPSEGYTILQPPASYVPIHTPARKLIATPAPMAGAEGFAIPEEEETRQREFEVPSEIPGVGALPFFKEADMEHFGKLLDGANEADLSTEELKERKIMRLLLKIKNGTPAMRKVALRQITDKARDFGAEPLFKQILPLLMSTSLEDQERHLLVKVIDRILYKLDDLVRPFVHKILVVIEPLLIDEDYYARVEGREIVSNLSKAAGLATMIATMRPDIDHTDEYVRNTTARAFAVVASALGIPALMPFLKAVCKSKKSWQARHTGIKIIQQIAILMGCAILPHLKGMVDAIAHGLEDEQQKVRTITALSLAALAEAAAPYGIESFDSVLKPLWEGIRRYRGKGLAAFLKAIGFIIPLMDAEYANYYTREVMVILIREFQSPDEEIKKIVLKVVKQCASTDGIDAKYIKEEVLPPFFINFWV
ncbi:U2 snRNP component prp10, partial [Spiromyces aspiralis]